jgi:hypothetical protein
MGITYNALNALKDIPNSDVIVDFDACLFIIPKINKAIA